MPILLPAPDRIEVLAASRVDGGRVVTLSGAAGSVQLAPADAVLRILAGADAWDMPDADVQLREVPGEDGAREDDVRLLPRDVLLPLRMASTSRPEHRALRDLLVRIINPKSGRVTLTVTEDDGTSRQIVGRYVSGARAGHGTDASGPTWTVWQIVLRVADPAWMDTSDTPIPPVRPVTSVGGFFPLLGRGLRLMPDLASGEVALDVDGHLDALPTWRIDGPAATWTIADLDDPGDYLAWSGTLTAGEWIEVGTYPDPYIVDNTGASRYSELEQDVPPAFFALRPGRRRLTLSITGGDAAAGSAISGRYRRRWLIQA